LKAKGVTMDFKCENISLSVKGADQDREILFNHSTINEDGRIVFYDDGGRSIMILKQDPELERLEVQIKIEPITVN